MIYLSVVLICASLFILYLSYRKKVDNNQQLQKINEQIELQNKVIENNYKELNNLQQSIKNRQSEILSLAQQKNDLKAEIDKEVEEKATRLNALYNNLQESSSLAFQSYEQALDQAYNKKENEITTRINQMLNQKIQVEEALSQVKNAVQAANAARLVQEEENNKWLFYSLNLTDNQLNDILELDRFKHRLNDTSLVGKIIWSAFVLKATNDLCNRILGATKKCGIYKITNHETEQVYIGQSVNVSDRWKAHIKSGLGIDAPATNRLYNKMQQYGVWMFTFELLEECSKEKLNEREKFWIDFYHSDKIGMNGNSGNKT